MKVCEHIYITNFADVGSCFSSETHVGHCCLDWQFLFKKYLDYEKSQGDDERIESVKRKAMEYVESTMSWCKVIIALVLNFKATLESKLDILRQSLSLLRQVLVNHEAAGFPKLSGSVP